ncbi:UNVERIFIED_CONTAM: hypothetical protein FKN15_038368 [Acipenser sinensis]
MVGSYLAEFLLEKGYEVGSYLAEFLLEKGYEYMQFVESTLGTLQIRTVFDVYMYLSFDTGSEAYPVGLCHASSCWSLQPVIRFPIWQLVQPQI